MNTFVPKNRVQNIYRNRIIRIKNNNFTIIVEDFR